MSESTFSDAAAHINLGPVAQSVVSLTCSLRVISWTVLAESIHNILIFFAEKNVSSFCTAKATHIFISKKIQHICVSLDVNFNESLTNAVVSYEQLDPVFYLPTMDQTIIYLCDSCLIHIYTHHLYSNLCWCSLSCEVDVLRPQDHIETQPAQWLSGKASTLWSVNCGFDPRPGHTKDFQMVLAALLLGAQH